jgi:hypothetical protein
MRSFIGSYQTPPGNASSGILRYRRPPVSSSGNLAKADEIFRRLAMNMRVLGLLLGDARLPQRITSARLVVVSGEQACVVG